jgi:preprotein translocase subunit SecD
MILAASATWSADLLSAGDPVPGDAVAVFRTGSEALAMGPGDVTEASPQFGEDGAGLRFRLSPEAGAVFSDLTGRSIGKELTLFVCDTLLVSAVVRDRLDGNGYVALESLGSAVFYASRMTGEKPCG